jgi:hypothetical protein
MIQRNISITTLECCGVKEIHGISYYHSELHPDYLKYCVFHILTKVGKDMRGKPRTLLHLPAGIHLLFTQASSYENPTNPYGEKLRDFITENKLGTVIETPAKVNPNSDNYVVAFLWTMDRVACSRWTNLQMEELGKLGEPTPAPEPVVVPTPVVVTTNA